MTEEIKDQYITVKLLGSGYAAVHMVLVKDETGEYWDVQQTGVGRFSANEKLKAIQEAQSWSQSDGIPLKL